MAPRHRDRWSSVRTFLKTWQRVRKRQPDGGFAGEGRSPSRMMRLRPRS